MSQFGPAKRIAVVGEPEVANGGQQRRPRRGGDPRTRRQRLVVEYRSQRGLVAVLGINAGAAVMSRRPEIVRTYLERSAFETAMA